MQLILSTCVLQNCALTHVLNPNAMLAVIVVSSVTQRESECRSSATVQQPWKQSCFLMSISWWHLFADSSLLYFHTFCWLFCYLTYPPPTLRSAEVSPVFQWGWGRNREMHTKVHKLSIAPDKSKDLMHSRKAIVNNIVYWKFAESRFYVCISIRKW
jgi:hypothetical protein